MIFLELDQFRNVDLVIDKANDNFIAKQFVSEGDFSGRTLTVQLTNGGVIGKVPGAQLALRWRNKASGLTDLSAFELIDADNSVFRITYPDHMLNAGTVEANIMITHDGKTVMTKAFEIRVAKLDGELKGIIDKQEFSYVLSVLADANRWRTDIDSKAEKSDLDKKAEQDELDLTNLFVNGLSVNKVDKGGMNQITLGMLAPEIKDAMTENAVAYIGPQIVDMTRLNADIQSDIGEWQEVLYSTVPGRWNNDGTELNSEAALLDYLRTEIPTISGSVIRLQYDVNRNKHFVFLDSDNEVVSNQNYTNWQTNINVPDRASKVRIDFRKDETKTARYYVLSYLPIATKREITESIEDYQNDFKINGELPNKSVGLYQLNQEIQADIYETEEMSSTWVAGGWLANGNADNGRYAMANYLRTEYLIPENELGQTIVLQCRPASNSKIIYEIGEGNEVINAIEFISDSSEQFLIAPDNRTKTLRIRVSNNVEPKLAKPFYGGIASKRYVQNALKETDFDDVPDYWKSHMDLKVDEINEKMRTIDGDAYIFITDCHWYYNEQQSPKLIKYLLDKTRVKKVFFGGDIVQAYGTKQDMIDWSDKFFQAFSFLNNSQQLFWITGNHDFTIRDAQGSAGGNTLPLEEQYNYFAQPTDTYIDYPSDKLYYFKDNTSKKIRYVFLNMHEKVDDVNAYWSLKYYVSQAQIDWLLNKAVDVDSDWSIVVIGHEPIISEMSSYASEFDILKDIFEAYNSKSSLSKTYDDKVVDVDFKDVKGKILLYQNGHSHKDESVKTDHMLYVSTGCDARYTDDKWDRVKTTDTEQLFDVVIVDKKTAKINMIRIGAGENREFIF